jgi:hypothetical protein
MEHRLGSRVPVRETVRVRTAEGELDEAVMTDISLSGAFVQARIHPPNLAPVYVTLADSRRPPSGGAVVKAQVVRNSAEGFGIEWWQFAPAAIMKRVAVRVPGGRATRPRKEGQPA